MPISVALPAPSIEWEYEWFDPAVTSLPSSAPNAAVGGVSLGRLATRSAVGAKVALDSNQTAVRSVQGYGTVGSAGAVIQRWELRHGRPCRRFSLGAGTTTQGECFLPYSWSALFAAGSNFNPGASQFAGQIVAVFDVHISVQLTGATPGWPNDTSPILFLPDSAGGSQNVRNNPPGGPGPRLGGFGMFVNNVGGAGRFEYVSFSSVAILERVTVGLSAVPNITGWNSFRFIIIGATPTRDAILSVQANGFDVVVGRTFGSALLQRPNQMVADSTGLTSVIAITGIAADQIFYSVAGKIGRFTPAGAELQGE